MANECLKRTPTSTGNQRVWTWSGWIKLNNLASGGISGSANLFRLSSGASNDSAFRIEADNKLMWYVNGTTDANLKSDRLMRDVGSWTHIMGVVNTTTSVSNDRVKIYVNGALVNKFSTETYPSIDYITSWNGLVSHAIGATPTSTEPLDGQMFDVFFIDGQALTPEVFGFYKDGNGYISAGSTQSTDFRPGQWVPKTPRVIKAQIERNGGFGVNGFYLPMNDSSNFGADFHTTPNSIITLKGEDLQQPRNGAPTTTDAYVSQLRTDPYAANLVLALPFVNSGLCTNGTNVGVNTGFGDYSHIIRGNGSAKVAILNNNVSIANTASYYGSAAFFDGTTDSIRIPLSSDFDFGSGNFTLESWVYVISGNGIIFSIWDSANNQRVINFQMGNGSGTDGQCPTIGISLNGSTATFLEAANNIAPVNQWHHVAAVRENTKLSLYLNGVCVGINTNISGSLFTPVDDVYIGAEQSGSSDHFGYLQDLRIYKGVAKYKGGFDVPKPYTPVGIGTWRAVSDTTANNFATLNPLIGAGVNAGDTVPALVSGNLYLDNANQTWAPATIGVSTGKYYAEFMCLNGVQGSNIGVCGDSIASRNSQNFFNKVGVSYIRLSSSSITKSFTSTSTTSGSIGYTSGDIVGVTLDVTNKEIKFFKNNVGIFTDTTLSGFTTTNTHYYFTPFRTNDGATPAGSDWSDVIANFGQNPTFSGNITAGLSTFTDGNGKGLFRYEPPTDFLALCEDNLPTPAIKNPGEYFKSVLWTGDGNSGRSITGIGFTPDLVWIKCRTNAENHLISDSVRGAGLRLFPNLTNAEDASPSSFLSFDSDGFSLGSNASFNGDGRANVAWCWRAGAGTTSINTDGSIDSVVSVNQDAGFSIVSYTGNGSNPTTVGHGLEKAPKFILFKRRNSAVNWFVYHGFNSSGAFEGLNTTNAYNSALTLFNQTAPTSSVINLGNTDSNASGGTYIAYCWAEIEGFSKFGSYVGNFNADGPFVYCGFKPAWIVIKRTDDTSDWIIVDSSRSPVNGPNLFLYPNLTATDAPTNIGFDFLSNGFKLRGAISNRNASGGTYIFAAFAESPFTTANAK